MSCQNFPDGYFTPYEEVANSADIHAVVHLGDYIYEGPSQTFRKHEPLREIFSLDDYRIRHGQYKTDVHLQAAHAAHPWLVTWDDHEFKNNYADLDFDPDVPVEVATARRAAAYRGLLGAHAAAPRPQARGRVVPALPPLPLGRPRDVQRARRPAVPLRPGRARLHAGAAHAERLLPGVLEPGRTMLGAEQRDWLLEELATTTARWNVLANQTAFAPFDNDAGRARGFGAGDNWDGYVAERQQLLNWMVEKRTPNPIVITGDSHNNWVRNVPPDHVNFDAPPVATEFMGTSISTGGDERGRSSGSPEPQNPHILIRNNNRGYVRCTLTPDAWTSEFRKVVTVRRPAPRACRWRPSPSRTGSPARIGSASSAAPWGRPRPGRSAPPPFARGWSRAFT